MSPYPHKPRRWGRYTKRQKRAWFATRGFRRPIRKRKT